MIGDGAVFPGDAQRHGFKAWGGAVWSGTCDALRGRGGVFDGERWLCIMGQRTGMSGGLLGRWGLCMHAERAARGLWVMVEGGALAHAWHVWARLVRVVQGLAMLAAGTVSDGGRWAAS